MTVIKTQTLHKTSRINLSFMNYIIYILIFIIYSCSSQKHFYLRHWKFAHTKKQQQQQQTKTTLIPILLITSCKLHVDISSPGLMYAVRYFLNLLKLRNAFSNVFPGGFERNTKFCLVGNLYLIWNSRDNFTYI